MSSVPTHGGPRIDPRRDLLVCYPQVIASAARRFEAHAWPELEQFVYANGGTWDGLCDTYEAVTKFLQYPVETPETTMRQALEDSGWFKVTDAERIGMFAMFGSIMMGQLHYSIRETTPLGTPSEPMVAFAETLRGLMCKPTPKPEKAEQSSRVCPLSTSDNQG